MSLAIAALLAASSEVSFSAAPATRVSQPTIGRPIVEPHLSAHPLDAARLLAAAMVVGNAHAPFETSRLQVFASADGGATWREHTFQWFGYDPWTHLRSDGRTLVVWLGGTDPDSEARPIRIFRSADAGATWSSVVETVEGAFDGAKLAVGGDGEAVLMAATTFVHDDSGMRSRVAVYRVGDSVGPPAFLDDGPTTRVAAQPAWLNRERVLVPALSTPAGASGPEVWVHTSNDGGRSFAARTLVSRKLAPGLGYAQLVAPQAASADSGRVAFVRALRPPLAAAGIWVNTSGDGGRTWSGERRVDRHADSHAVDVRVPSAAVSADGTLGVTWIDRRHDPEGSRNHLYFAWSHDGGETFSSPIPVSDVASDPETPENGATAGLLPAGGHYLGLTALVNGNFQALWSDSRDGTFALYTAGIRRSAGPSQRVSGMRRRTRRLIDARVGPQDPSDQ